ncbi:MAG TPA: POTRA domain-containing protein [Pyrinomonadaceae bacterium]|nr:POTRA domain-containing protein [Pyrinomonadaceae bacterium]
MKRLTNYLLILIVFTFAAPLAAAQDARVISKIEFEGLQQIKAEEALSTSGLKPDQPFKLESIDAAAQRMLDSGIFKQVAYRTRTAGNKVTVTFKVEEAGGGDSPVFFDNFIWFTDEQLIEAVRSEVPLFTGRAPNIGKTPEAITRALQKLLNDQKIPGTVEYVASQDLSGHMLGHMFSVSGVKMPICTVRFPGAKNLAEEKLAAIAKEIFDTDYSGELVRGFSGMKLIAAYREAGQLRAKFAPPVGKPDPRCQNNGVVVTLPVEEGLIYSWAGIDWTGVNALTPDQLNSVLGIKPGEVANGVKFDRGLIDVQKAYGRQGYIQSRLMPTPEFDDNARKVLYKIDVLEGPQYRMGGLAFRNLTERDAKALRDVWRMKRGDIFDQGYLDEYFKQEAGRALLRLSQERQSGGKEPPKLGTNIKANRETLTVDVTLELTNP